MVNAAALCSLPPSCPPAWVVVKENPDGAKFCNACGAALVDAWPAGEERRLVSVLFVDLVGFTGSGRELDPEDVRAILMPYYERVRAELQRYGGTVEKFIGDAVMGVSELPTAYGDDPERAVRAAFAVRDWAEQEGLEVRVAVNTGEAIVELDARPGTARRWSRRRREHGGTAPDCRARRIGVLVGEETYAATRNPIEYRPAQPVLAKGKSAPVRAWLAVRATRRRRTTVAPVPMIGETANSRPSPAFGNASPRRHAQFVTVFGPSGIGKSRLASSSPSSSPRRGACDPGTLDAVRASAPYSAFAQQVKQVATDLRQRRARVSAREAGEAVAELAGPAAAEEHAPHLAMLLGLGERRRDVADRETLFFSAARARRSPRDAGARPSSSSRTSTGPTRACSTCSRRSPRASATSGAPLALARPELLDRAGRAGAAACPPTRRCPSIRSPADCGQELAEQLLARVADRTAQGARSLVETAEGNPLFIEELAASLAERSTRGPAHERPRASSPRASTRCRPTSAAC